MANIRDKFTFQQFYSKIADKIGDKIRQKIIETKKSSHYSKKYSLNQSFNHKNKLSTSQNEFWSNPYKIQKNNWSFTSTPKYCFYQKQQVDQTKKQQLSQFKKKLKTQMNVLKQRKIAQTHHNISRVRQIRENNIQSRNQKLSMFIQKKQRDAQTLRQNLRRSKFEANIRRRQRDLQLSFSRWHRLEQKMTKHRNKFALRQNVKTQF